METTILTLMLIVIFMTWLKLTFLKIWHVSDWFFMVGAHWPTVSMFFWVLAFDHDVKIDHDSMNARRTMMASWVLLAGVFMDHRRAFLHVAPRAESAFPGLNLYRHVPTPVPDSSLNLSKIFSTVSVEHPFSVIASARYILSSEVWTSFWLVLPKR